MPFARVEVAPGWRGTQPRERKWSPHEWEMKWSPHEWELCGGGGALSRGIGSGHRTSTSCAEVVGHTAAGEAVAIAHEWELCGGGGAHSCGNNSGHRTRGRGVEAVEHTAAGEVVGITRAEEVWGRWGKQPREK